MATTTADGRTVRERRRRIRQRATMTAAAGAMTTVTGNGGGRRSRTPPRRQTGSRSPPRDYTEERARPRRRRRVYYFITGWTPANRYSPPSTESTDKRAYGPHRPATRPRSARTDVGNARRLLLLLRGVRRTRTSARVHVVDAAARPATRKRNICATTTSLRAQK